MRHGQNLKSVVSGELKKNRQIWGQKMYFEKLDSKPTVRVSVRDL